jgi:pimeloyl-ACP methyl ester carboxylesterase
MNITIDGANFAVRDEGRGPAMVLLHGFPLANEIWDAQAAALVPSARVVRFDLRGLGISAATPGPYLMEALAGDVLEIIDALGIERAVLVGHSLGGYVALAFYRMFAERCAGLAFVCSRPGADDPATARGRRVLAEAVERERAAPLVAAFVPRYFAPAVYGRWSELVARATAIVERTDRRGAAALLRGMADRVSADDILGDIDVPVQIVAGRWDAIIALDEQRAFAAAIAGAELEILECGHMPQLEAPEALSGALVRFAAGVSSRADRR